MTDMDEPQADPPTPTFLQLEVVNNTGFTIHDFFDGIPVTFPLGQPVTISAAAGMHLFGYPGEPKDMALHMAKRFGWSGREYLKPEGVGDVESRYEKLAAQIKITPIYFDLVRRDRNAPIPADDGSEDDSRVPVGDGPDDTTKVGKRIRKPRAAVARPPRRSARPMEGRTSRSR